MNCADIDDEIRLQAGNIHFKWRRSRFAKCLFPVSVTVSRVSMVSFGVIIRSFLGHMLSLVKLYLFMCVDMAVSLVSSETVQQLDRLMVEGSLLPVDVEQLHSLHIVLAACDSDNYGIKVIEFEVRLPLGEALLSSFSCNK